MAPKKVAEKTPVDVWVVILCGLPGSGKSTLRSRLVQKGWAYVSQDEMGSADACEKALVKALKSQKSCVVDRCNVTSSERRLWMQYANRAVEKKEAKGVKLHFEAVWMAVSPEVCKERVRSRKQHETLGPEHADAVIDDFCKGMRVPERTGQEPYECVQFVATDEDANLVVQRYANPSCIDASIKAASSSSSALATTSTSASTTALETQHQDLLANADVFILRHGERADRARDHDGGWVDDPPLTKDGRETAKRAGAALRALTRKPWAVVYSSPFFRCLQTANEVAAELGIHVRVEPGLSELCIEKIFEQQPRLRGAAEALQLALTRVEVDLSCTPVHSALPVWPEEVRSANSRVVQTAQALVARHPGQSIVLVCHAHSLVELTRRLPESGGGAASSNPGYCALSHITSKGQLLKCLDLSFLRHAGTGDGGHHTDSHSESMTPIGHWETTWTWNSGGMHDSAAASFAGDDLEDLLSMGLDAALEEYPAFRMLFERGTVQQQATWRNGWTCGDEEIRKKLQKAKAAGVFRCPSSLPFAPSARAVLPPAKLFPGPEDLATEEGDAAFEAEFHSTHSLLKFPSTAHLKNLGAATRDDKLCDPIRQRSFAGGCRRVSIEEKIDGANLGISLDSSFRFRLQARSKMISWSSDPQFAGLELWLETHRSTLCEVLERNNDILFGEWCAYRHTVAYTALPGYFLAFDIFDKRKGAFLSRSSFHTRLQRAAGKKIPVVPMLFAPRVFSSVDEVVELLNRQSRFGEGIIEGVYLRIDAENADGSAQETYLEDRCKLVRSEFQQAIVDGGSWRGGARNELCMDLALSYVDDCYVCALPSSSVERDAGTATASKDNYPSTPHLPFSPGVNADDILLADCRDILQEEVVVTEKFDGGNCCIKGGQVYARTHAQPATHESFSAVKQLSQCFGAQLDGIELFGENMQGIHSIEYRNLTSFFYVFAARSDGQWLAWDDVVALAKSLDLPTVPVIFRGRFESPSKLQSCLETWASLPSAIGEDVKPEGFVLRRTHAFPNGAFQDNMAKYVRADHIQTDPDWKRRWKKAQLGPALQPRDQPRAGASGDAENRRESGLAVSATDTAELKNETSSLPPTLVRQESHPLLPDFSQWLKTAILEELQPDDAQAIIDCAEVILQGAHSDPSALESAVEVLKDSGAPLCAAALPRQWQSKGCGGLQGGN